MVDATDPPPKALVNRLIAELIPYPNNARTHSPEQIAQIAGSIKEFGFTNPVLIDGKNGIIAGHGRALAAAKLGMRHVPCLVLDHLTDAQRRAYILADNRLALSAGWDNAMLEAEVSRLLSEGFDIKLTGFDQAEIDKIMAVKTKGLTDEDDAPTVPLVPISKIGDTWILGKHRVRCGDSTKAEDVTALLAGVEPHLMVTDPPYGVEYDPEWRNRVQRQDGSMVAARAVGEVHNDDRADWREAWALFPGHIAYVWHAGLHSSEVAESLEATGFKLRSQIIWNKSNFAIGRGDYHWKHEPCWYGVRGTGQWTGDRKQSTVWDIQKPLKSETGHSTQKPVECMRRPMLNNSNPGQVVYDPFLGSGTTVIAAETEGRTCYGMELSPEYVDVIVTRWQSFTGQTAKLESTGEEFTAVGGLRKVA